MMDEDCAIGRWEQRLALSTDREALDSYGGNGFNPFTKRHLICPLVV